MTKQRTANLLGVHAAYILKRCGGARSDEATNARHEKMAATFVLQELITGSAPASLAKGWTSPDGIGQKGTFPMNFGGPRVIMQDIAFYCAFLKQQQSGLS